MLSNIYYESDKEYYQQLSRDYYHSNRERLLKYHKEKYNSLSKEEKDKFYMEKTSIIIYLKIKKI